MKIYCWLLLTFLVVFNGQEFIQTWLVHLVSFLGPLFYAANAMVFGSVASATSWEPFRRAIPALYPSFFVKILLLLKHKKWLDMVCWADPPDDQVVFIKAEPCSKIPGL